MTPMTNVGGASGEVSRVGLGSNVYERHGCPAPLEGRTSTHGIGIDPLACAETVPTSPILKLKYRLESTLCE